MAGHTLDIISIHENQPWDNPSLNLPLLVNLRKQGGTFRIVKCHHDFQRMLEENLLPVPWGFDASALLTCSPGLEVGIVQGVQTTGDLEDVPMESISKHCIVPVGILAKQGRLFLLSLKYAPIEYNWNIQHLQIQMTYVDCSGRTICTVYNMAFEME